MTIKLRYDVTTTPFPLQASPATGSPSTAQLTVVASNPNPDPVKNPVVVHGISITIPVGPDANQLTVTQPSAPVAPYGWKLQDIKPGDETVEYVFTPQAGQGAVGKQGLAFVFNNITVNTEPGPCQLIVEEGSAGNPSAPLYVTKFPNGWGTVSFLVNPIDITPGEGITLNWSGPAGATYTIEYYDIESGQIVNVPTPGAPPLGKEGQYPSTGDPPLKPIQTTTFTLEVADTLDGVSYATQMQQTVTVEVPRPSIKCFTATPTYINPPKWTSVTLAWETENVSELVIDGKLLFKGSKALKGSCPYEVSAPVSCLLTAYGLQGYTGQPTIAATQIGIPGSATSPLLWLFQDSLQPKPLWTLTAGAGEDVFAVAASADKLEKKGTVNYTGIMQPSPGVLAAYLGPNHHNINYDDIKHANYTNPLTHNVIWSGVDEYFEDGSASQEASPFDPGATFAFKLPGGRVLLLWYERWVSGPNYSLDYSFSFDWIDYGEWVD